MTTAQDSYSAPAKFGHWLVALLLLVNYSLGWTMISLQLSPLQVKLINYHKWVGVTVFVLTVLRVVWRLLRPPPPWPPQLPHWQRQAAEITHRLLYLLLFALPLSGWLMSSAEGFQVVYFGRWPIPDVLGKNAALGEALSAVHAALTWLLLALVSVHVLAAIKHQFVDRDGMLWRMLWRRSHVPQEPR